MENRDPWDIPYDPNHVEEMIRRVRFRLPIAPSQL